MYLSRLNRRSSVKVRIDGPDAKGKNTSRQIMVCDAHVDEVEGLIRPILEEATRKSAGQVSCGGQITIEGAAILGGANEHIKTKRN